MSTHHRVLWVLQWVFGVYFIAIGVLHFIVPEGRPDLMSWMYELDESLRVVSGIAEILGGLGLTLPGLTGIRPELTIAAAAGLFIVMLGAIIFHVGRDGPIGIGTNVLNAVFIGYIAYGRWRLAPLGSSEPTTA